jgi:selenium metabolism protein YedF
MDDIINVTGLPCPFPVIEAKKALLQTPAGGVVRVLVDNPTACENLAKLAEGKSLGYHAAPQGDGTFLVTLTQAEGGVAGAAPIALPSQPVATVRRPLGTVVTIATSSMGTGDETLGKQLLKGFAASLAALDVPPESVFFYNNGAFLTGKGSPVLEELKALAAKGTRIATCGMCLDFYGIKADLAVGEVTNMLSIVEAQAGAGRVINI